MVEQTELDRIHDELTAEMDRAMQWAIDAPYPAVEEVGDDVYA
jgi:TPP-dependent pyruvate/acetoin dehydrogenase alpha subunit